MADHEAATNLADVACDRLSLWNSEARAHQDVRELFVSNGQVTQPTRVQQQVGDETDEILLYEAPTNAQVPALKDLVDYIQQERLGEGSVVNKYYNISRTNTQQIHTEETVVARRGRDGRRGPRGAAGKAQTVVQEGDVFVRTREGPRGHRGARGAPGVSVADDAGTAVPGRRGRQGTTGKRGDRGPQGETGVAGPPGRRGPAGERGEKGDQGEQGEKGDAGYAGGKGDKGEQGERGTRGARGDLVHVEGDTILHRTTKNTSTRNTYNTIEQSVTLNTRTVSNTTRKVEQLHFHEGPSTTFKASRHEHAHRHVLEAPVFHTLVRNAPRVSVRRAINLEVFAPVLFQRIRNVSRISRPIFLFAPC